MRILIRRWIRLIVKRDVIWNVLEPTVVRLGLSLKDHRVAAFVDECVEWREEYFQNKCVINGIFRGMQYSSFKAFGSTLYPKLLGSYESEISEAIAELNQIPLEVVVDVGCAEGYYAIGFALQNSDATVYAFDLNESARDECRAMADCNKVSDRVIVEGYCDSFRLAEFSKEYRTGLVLSDCEGFERYLFSDASATDLACWYLLIETHDFASTGVTDRLVGLFESTHDIRIFEALPDEIKVDKYQFEEIKKLDLRVQHMLLAENRPSGMKWLYMKPVGEVNNC